MRIDLPQDDAIEVQMAPLIDCVFLLLIFFLVASTLKEPTSQLELTLPQASAAQSAVADAPLVISIDAAGSIYLEGSPVASGQIVARLRAVLHDTPDRPLRLDADRLTPYHAIITLLVDLQGAGLNQVALNLQNRQ